ncbi:MAG: replication-associated recombination protein A [Bacteroidetes bacterium]|nr:replication-associated recombination protein A [Bacteroidota bacterium]
MIFQTPLAEALRPRTLDEFTGQHHLVGTGAVLRTAIESGNIPSLIFWGPPGTGKTTLARIIADRLNRSFYTLSAVDSGVRDVRAVINRAKEESARGETSPEIGKGNAILFIDEIHRFSKAQQDSLLGAVEQGIITLIGATTENPSFEVISPLLSRCQVYILSPLDKDELLEITSRTCRYLQSQKGISVTVAENEVLLRLSGGDARKLLNLVELFVSTGTAPFVVTNRELMEKAQQKLALYDKGGEQHYDIISAFIKSIRGSDPNGAVYWLARMIEGGEDPEFIARRMLILASEDIGNANPTALVLANNCFQAVHVIGYPECDLILSQTAIYLALSVKSNSSYLAILKAKKAVRESGDLPVPLHLRNAPTRLMKELGYGKNYQYAHDYDLNFSGQEYLPDKITGTTFYEPGKNKRENELRDWLKKLWKEKYGY